jgi:hypothetical protein
MQRWRLAPLRYGVVACMATAITGLASFPELGADARVVCLIVASLLSGAVVMMTAPNKKSSNFATDWSRGVHQPVMAC